MTIKKILLFFQIIIPTLLIVFILLQQRGAALGAAFGQEGFYIKRRGAEKTIFLTTVVLSIVFVVISLLSLVIK